jgi:6-phosphofructokinase 1
MKTLIVVSGGDAPGINTVLARYVAIAHSHGDQVIGSGEGFVGVLQHNLRQPDLSVLRLLEGTGGSFLPSSREPMLSAPDAEQRLKAVLADNGIDNLLLFGGDGTLKYVLPLLRSWNIPVIALPTTIDNDVAGTERTLGFDSACNFAYQAIDGVLATAHALTGRIFMVETLGGDTGFLALEIGSAAGAHTVLVPEYQFDMDWFAQRLKSSIAREGFALVVLSEGVKAIPDMPEAIPRLTGIRLRYTKLGHSQRGGDVTHADRKLATEMAQIAHQAFRSGITSGTVIVQNGQTVLYQGTFGLEKKAPPDRQLYNLVNGL